MWKYIFLLKMEEAAPPTIQKNFKQHDAEYHHAVDIDEFV